MKIVEIIAASFILLVFTTAFISKSPVLAPVCVDKQLKWDGGGVGGANFIIATGSKNLLDDALNWEDAIENYSSFSCWGTSKLCKIRIEYCYTPPFESDPSLTVQEIINAVHTIYNDAVSPHVFSSNPFFLNKDGIVITLTVLEKAF